MKHIYYVAAIAFGMLVSACTVVRSSADGITGTEIATYTESINRYDLDVDPEGITYTIDISTEEGRITLEGKTVLEARKIALEQAAIKNNCAKIISPKFSELTKGKHVLRVTVFGFPARYKNSDKTATPDKEAPQNNVIIVK